MEYIFSFLRDIAVHNDREWFAANRSRYDEAMARFTAMAEGMIARVGQFEPAVTGMPVKQTLYRFYRDTRFSPDKSPYKRHFGCYINPKGKKSLHGGYYFHIEPGNCLLAVGAYGLPSPVLRAVRWSIVNETERFHATLAGKELAKLKPVLGETYLKTVPAGFPRDFSHPEYLRPKEYDLWLSLPDEAFLAPGWQDETARIFRLMKPYLDFINETVDDYI